MRVTVPAPITIPNNISRIGILNRFENTSNHIINKIDEVFSAEAKNLDKDASNSVIEGLRDALKLQNRFDVVLINDSTLTTNNISDFPSTLTWETIENLCTTNKVDAIYVLSYFDTDSKLSYSTKKAFTQNILGVKIPVLEHYASAHN